MCFQKGARKFSSPRNRKHHVIMMHNTNRTPPATLKLLSVCDDIVNRFSGPNENLLSQACLAKLFARRT